MNFIQIDPRDATQICANCGRIVKKALSERVHECPFCGFIADRDSNAAVNIHRVGMEQPFEPVETMPLQSHLSDASIVHEAGSHAREARGSSRSISETQRVM
jgi:transposase